MQKPAIHSVIGHNKCFIAYQVTHTTLALRLKRSWLYLALGQLIFEPCMRTAVSKCRQPLMSQGCRASVTLRQLNMLVRHEYLRAAAHTVHKYMGTSTIAFVSWHFRSLPAGDVWWRDTLSHVKGLRLHHCLHRNLWLAKQTSNSSNFK